jgi:hypothetical protein
MAPERMLQELRRHLAQVGVDADDVSASAIAVRTVHNDVGDIVIQYDEGEFSVGIGPHYHQRFSSQGVSDTGLSDVVQFISDFVTDRSVLTIQHFGSKPATARIDNSETGESSIVVLPRRKRRFWALALSLLFTKRKSQKSYRWSGPVTQYLHHPTPDEPGMSKLAEQVSGLAADELKELANYLDQQARKECGER